MKSAHEMKNINRTGKNTVIIKCGVSISIET